MENNRAVGQMYHRSGYLVLLITSILLHQMLVLLLMMMVAVYYSIKDMKQDKPKSKDDSKQQ